MIIYSAITVGGLLYICVDDKLVGTLAIRKTVVVTGWNDVSPL